MEQLSISVIVPTHNSSLYLREVLDSLKNQTFRQFEVLCIDSSSDDTPQIIESYIASGTPIKLITDKNGSYGHKINRGIDEASGRYIAILESDDMLRNDMLGILYNLAEKNKVDYIKSSYTSFLSNTGKIITVDQNRYNPEKYIGRIIDYYNEPDARILALNNIWTGLYRTEFLRSNCIRLHESSGASYQDTGFSVLCAAYARSVMYIRDCLYFYRRDNDSSSVKKQEQYKSILCEIDWIQSELIARDLMHGEVKRFFEEVKYNAYVWNALRLDNEHRPLFMNLLGEQEKESISREVKKSESRKELSDQDFLVVAKTLLGSKKVAIFGAGAKGRAVVRFIRATEIACDACIFDNDKNKWGESIEGFIIRNPLEINDFYEAVIIALDERFCDYVFLQLLNHGVEEKKLVPAPNFPQETELIVRIDKILNDKGNIEIGN